MPRAQPRQTMDQQRSPSNDERQATLVDRQKRQIVVRLLAEMLLA